MNHHLIQKLKTPHENANADKNVFESKPPGVSIIVPMKDEKGNAAECIECLLSQDYPGEYEIIASIPDEKDTTNDVISCYTHNPKVSVVYSGNNGKAEAMYKAASVSVYEILAFLDADCRPRRNWLSAMVSSLKRKNLDSICGWMCIRGRNPVAIAQTYDTILLLMLLLPSSFLWGGNLLILRKAYSRCEGGLEYAREEIAEDGALHRKLRELGGKHAVTLEPASFIEVIAKRTLSSFYKQRTRWAAIFLEGREYVGIFTSKWFLFHGVYAFFLLCFTIMFVLEKSLSFVLITLILISAYYLSDVFMIRRWAKKMKLVVPMEGVLFYFISLCVHAVAFYNVILYLLLGKTEKWKGGKHKD
jgi:cellulose synthase/poly-beta-1,6-N-acetylglucosamine synthase-like glycosyltransferase